MNDSHKNKHVMTIWYYPDGEVEFELHPSDGYRLTDKDRTNLAEYFKDLPENYTEGAYWHGYDVDVLTLEGHTYENVTIIVIHRTLTVPPERYA